MRRTVGAALAATALIALALGVSTAGAVSGPGANDNSKFVYSESIDRATSNLTVTIGEGGQKRFESVDYQLTGQAVTTSFLDGGQIIKVLVTPDPSTEATLSPDADGRVSGSLTLVLNIGPCACGGGSFRVDYTNLVLRNVSSGHVYRLDDASLSTP